MTRDDDREQMHQLKRGKVKALAALVERYKKKAYFLALHMVGNSDDAYDISQEAFLRVYSSAGTFDETQPFFPWFYSIIANLCRTLLRKRRIDASRSVDAEEVDYLLTDQTTPETDYLERERQRQLCKALLKLSFRDREIIGLNHFHMMSYDEIAELLHIPKGTVMSRLYYARRRLGTLMDEG